MATTVLSTTQIRSILGKCSGCFHAAPGEKKSSPGASSVCKLCVRNREATKGAAVNADDGRVVYGLRDCFIAFDRFEMELRGETFLKGVDVGG